MNARMISITVVVIMITCVTATGQLEDEDFTYGRPNGRFYLKRDGQARIDLLYGIEQGIDLMADQGAISKETVDLYTIKGFRFSELKDQVDRLYQDKANIRIPISYAYMYAVRRARGRSAAEMEDFLAQLRRRFLEK